MGLPIPEWMLSMSDLIGKAGPILAIVLLGVQVSRIRVDSEQKVVLGGAILAKISIGPLIGVGLTFLIGAQGTVRDVLLICSCLSTAINALVLTTRFNARPELLGGILIGSTLWSPLNLMAVLYWLGH